MPSEREWVTGLFPRLETALNNLLTGSCPIRVFEQKRLGYANEIYQYDDEHPVEQKRAGYVTDMLVVDAFGNGRWTPRIVVETKLDSVTTHDAITYSMKASTHKQVHPYLRYGILIGNWGEYALPARLFRHGAHFDFMMTWKSLEPNETEWKTLIEVLADEVSGSRKIETFLTTNRQRDKQVHHLVHRPFRLS